MRHQWHGDNRDLVKWGAVFHLVGSSAERTSIVYVPMLTPDDPPGASHRLNDEHAIAPEVMAFFRDVDHVRRLPWPQHVAFAMVEGLMRDRRGYFKQVAREIDAAARDSSRLLVLLDPDTGIEPPSGGTRAHLLRGEIADVYGRVRAGDLVAMYQHKRRTADWLPATRAEVAAAVGTAGSSVRTFTSSAASDVALHVIEKT